MRKLAITLALASSAIASPALALDHAWYVGVEGGAMIVEDTSFNYSLVRNGVTVAANPATAIGASGRVSRTVRTIWAISTTTRRILLCASYAPFCRVRFLSNSEKAPDVCVTGDELLEAQNATGRVSRVHCRV